MSALPEGSRCGLHNLSTESGRCERCDVVATLGFHDGLTHDEKRDRARRARWAAFAAIAAHPNERGQVRLILAACEARGIPTRGLDLRVITGQLVRLGQIVETGHGGMWAVDPDCEARYVARVEAARERGAEERATPGPLCL